MATRLTYMIADDDAVYRELTVMQLNVVSNLDCLAECNSALEIAAKLQEQQPDVLILDVEMPGLTGIQLAKSLTKLPLLIFISSHPTYAIDAFEVDAIDYLVKPAPPERLYRAIEKARQLTDLRQQVAEQVPFKKETDDSFFIRDKHAYVKIFNKDVLYIESLGDFVHIFLAGGEKKIALVSLKNLAQQLPSPAFLRISRTYIVNKDKITAVDTGSVMLNHIRLLVGKTYAESVLQEVVGNAAVKRYV